MEAEATTESATRATPPPTGPSGWRWGLATLTVVALILGGTFVTHGIVAKRNHPPATPAPALPPLAVVAVTAPGADYELTALDPSLGHLIALAADRQPHCPPLGACPAPPALNRIVLLDDATGQILASTSFTAEQTAYFAAATYLTVDQQSHRAYVIGPRYVAVISTATGQFISAYQLPVLADASWVAAAFDSAHQQLLVMASDGSLAIRLFDFPPLPPGEKAEPVGQYNGLALDAQSGVVYTLRRGAAGQGATLLAIDTTTLATVAQTTLATNATLGPIDPTTGALTLLGADGKTYRATLAAGQLSLASDGPANALALGWNPALNHTYVAHADDLQVLDVTGKPVASLPLRHYGGTTLLVDPARDLLTLTANDGSLILARDAATAPAEVPNAATAIVLARSALVHYLPDTNQDPPFLDGETFWPGATTPLASGGATATLDRDFWIHFSGRGWIGPYSGSASTSYTPLSGQPNTNRVTFAITWEQIFQRSHTWTLDVAPDGSVAYVSDSGDAVP